MVLKWHHSELNNSSFQKTSTNRVAIFGIRKFQNNFEVVSDDLLNKIDGGVQ